MCCVFFKLLSSASAEAKPSPKLMGTLIGSHFFYKVSYGFGEYVFLLPNATTLPY